MLEKLRKLKEQKGFTLIELIVVLVILAVLAALLIPALTGYIKKANEEKVISETRMVVLAAQTEATTAYAKTSPLTEEDLPKIAAIKALSEVKADVFISVEISTDGKVTKVVCTDGSFTCTYLNGDYAITNETPLAADVATALPTA